MQKKFHVIITIQTRSFTVMSLDGYEALSRPYYFDITFQANHDMDDQKFFNQTALISIYHDDHKTREITGIIVQCSMDQNTSPQHQIIKITLTSPLSLLKNKATPRLFLNKKTKDVIQQLLQSVGIQSFQFNLKNQYATHPMIMQTRDESDFDFLQRITAKEGFYYYFEHDKLIFTDHQEQLIQRKNKFIYRNDQIHFEENSIYDVKKAHKIIPEKFIVRDYNLMLPDKTIVVKAANNNSLGNIDQYGLGANETIEAEQFSEHLKRRSIVDSFRLIVHSHASDSIPGLVSTINLDGFDESIETNYLITEVIHHYRRTKTYSTKITCIDSKNIYQSPFPAHPRIPLCFTARIESNSHFAHLDENGGYKLRYDFDQTPFEHAEASPFIRRLNLYNGYQSKEDTDDHRVGIHCPLLNGSMVWVSCFDGNPDRPFIVGPLPNQQMLSPVTDRNPSQDIISTQSKNKWLLEDDPEKIGIFLETARAENALQMSSNPNKNQLTIQSTKGSLNISANQDIRKTTEKNLLIEVEKNSRAIVKHNFKLQTIHGKIQYQFRDGLIAAENYMKFSAHHNLSIDAHHDLNIQSDNIHIQADSINLSSQHHHAQLKAHKIRIHSSKQIHFTNSSAGIVLDPCGTITIYGQQISGNIAYNGKVNRIPSPASPPKID